MITAFFSFSIAKYYHSLKILTIISYDMKPFIALLALLAVPVAVAASISNDEYQYTGSGYRHRGN